MMRSIPPITSTGSKRRISSMDPIKFRTRGFNLNIGIGGINNKINKQETFKISTIKKPKMVKPNLGLKKLLAEAERKLEKVMEELKIINPDDLLDECTKLDSFIRQLKWQIAVRKER